MFKQVRDRKKNSQALVNEKNIDIIFDSLQTKFSMLWWLLDFFPTVWDTENSYSIVNENKTHKSKRTDIITSPDLEIL